METTSMKLRHVFSGVVMAVAVVGCADKSKPVPTPTLGSAVAGQTAAIAQPNVSGSVFIRQRIALPPDAVLTVTLSDASVADAPSKVLSQRVVRTEGKQAPFQFVLPFNPADIKPDARILLSAAISIDGKLAFITEGVKPVINQGGTKAELLLVPVPSMAMPTQPGAATTVPSTSPTQVTPFLPCLKSPAISFEIELSVVTHLYTFRLQCIPLPQQTVTLKRNCAVSVYDAMPGKGSALG
jgi:putative lipoprotein